MCAHRNRLVSAPAPETPAHSRPSQNQLRRQDVGLKTHLDQLDQRISELQLDVCGARPGAPDSDSRPSSGARTRYTTQIHTTYSRGCSTCADIPFTHPPHTHTSTRPLTHHARTLTPAHSSHTHTDHLSARPGFYELSDGGSCSLSTSCASVCSDHLSSSLGALLPATPHPRTSAGDCRPWSADETTVCGAPVPSGELWATEEGWRRQAVSRPRPVSTGRGGQGGRAVPSRPWGWLWGGAWTPRSPLRALGTLSPAGHLPGVLVPAPRAPNVCSCLRLGWRQESHTARVRQSGAAGIRPLSYYLKRASGGFLEGASGPSCSLTASSARVDTAPKGPGRFTGRPQAPVDLPVPLGGCPSRETPSQMRFSSSMRPGSGAGIRITGISGACSVFAQRATLRRPVPSGRACPRPPAASTPWPRADAISLGGLQIAPGRGLQRVQLSLGFIF